VTRYVKTNDFMLALNKKKAAEVFSIEAANIRLTILNKNDQRVAEARDWLATVLADEGDDLGAMLCLQSAIRTWRSYLPRTAHALALSLTNLAAVEAGQEQFDQASATIQDANKAFKLHPGSDDLLFAHMVADQIVNLNAGDRALEAIPLLQEVYQITKSHAGLDDPFTKRTLALLREINPQQDIMKHTIQPSDRLKFRQSDAVDLIELCPVTKSAGTEFPSIKP
jgi:hypothetical protein